MRSNLVDIQVVFHHQTDAAILVAADEETPPVWLPKSRVEVEDRPYLPGTVIDMTLPEPFAIEKELV